MVAVVDAELDEEQITRRVRWLNKVRRAVSGRKLKRGADHVGKVLDEAARAGKKLKKDRYSDQERAAAAEAAGKEVERAMKED